MAHTRRAAPERKKLRISARATRAERVAERVLNSGVRRADRALGRVGLGGRRADYDDAEYSFVGGMAESLRKKHYDKSLRLLWKAEAHAPWSTFRDLSRAERQLEEMASQAMTTEERSARARINSEDFRATLDQHYTVDEKRAMVALLAAIGHGEAYAWLVSAEVLRDVKSTGAKAAATMQVLEEAKHFVVLRELIKAFDVEVPRQSVWEYILLEQVLRAPRLEKFFGMNIVVEGIALSIFGMLSTFPGLEILRQFHVDESRHTALPQNYFKEFPMSAWERHNPVARARRLAMVLPAIPLLIHLEAPAAELGLDTFDFGGSIVRKVTHLAGRVGYELPLPYPWLSVILNALFNGWCYTTREGHTWRDFTSAETTRGARELAVERAVFGFA